MGALWDELTAINADGTKTTVEKDTARKLVKADALSDVIVLFDPFTVLGHTVIITFVQVKGTTVHLQGTVDGQPLGGLGGLFISNMPFLVKDVSGDVKIGDAFYREDPFVVLRSNVLSGLL